MGRVRYTIGQYSKTSYIVPQTNSPVHCIEELCFVLQENAFLLDREICDDNLVRWLEENCGLPDLAKQLRLLLRQNGSSSAMAGLILDYAGYGTAQKRSEIERLLRESSDMDLHLKKMKHADYLVEHQKYALALAEYTALLPLIPEENHLLCSQVMVHKATVLCRLFFFEDAAEQFYQAYQEYPLNERAAVGYLAALRMLYTDEDYIAFIADNKQWYDYSLKLEKEYSDALGDYPASENAEELRLMEVQKDTAGAAVYYEKLADKLTTMKQAYRDMVSE
jgi:hypothetical protein